MREKIYKIIKSPTEGEHETSPYDVFMIVAIIASLLPLTYKQALSDVWLQYIEHISVGIFIVDYFFTMDCS